MPEQIGDGYIVQPKPLRTRIKVGCGAAGALVDISSDVDRSSVKIKRTASTGNVTAEWDLWAWTDLVGGTRYTIQDWQNVQIDDPDTGDALFMGYTMEVSDRVDGAEKIYHITCQSVNIDLDKPTRQIVTQYPPFDGSPVVNTIVALGVSAGAQTFVVTNAAHLYAPYTDANGHAVGGKRVVATNADGTNREVITVSTVSGANITATFRSTKSANWVLSGGVTDYDLVVGGFKAMNPSGTMIAYQSLLDEYFNYPSDGSTAISVLRNAVSTCIYSLPHMKAENTTPRKFLQTITEQNTLPNYRRTVSASASVGSAQTITPDAMTGIVAGSFIYMSNANGSNPERQMVLTAGVASFTIDIAYAKTGTGPAPWIINTGAAPWFSMVWDNSFTRQLFYGDLYDFTLTTPIELTDVSTISGVQSHYNVGFERRISGADRGSKIDTVGALGAVGSYEDTAVSALLPRVVALEPVSKPDLLTNADCVTASQQTVAQFSKSKESVLQLSTHQQISATLFRSAHIVHWTGNLEGGTPAYYPIQDCELSYATGIAMYTFTLGDRLGELGDKGIPAYGAGSFHDFTAPQAPTWAGGTAWILTNAYDPAVRRSIVTVQATLSGELDLFRAHFAYRVSSGAWQYSSPVVIAGGATSAQFATPELAPSVAVDFQTWVIDTSGNVSSLSSIASTTTAAIVLPVAPTMTAEASNHYNSVTQLVDVGETFTVGSQPSGIVVDHYEATVTPTGGYTRYYTYPHMGIGVALFDGLDPGVSCAAIMYTVDSTGVYSLASSTRNFTTVSTPTVDSLKNPKFATSKYSDNTQPDFWTKTLDGASSGATGALSTAVILEGPNTLKFHQTGSDPSFVQYDSDQVHVWIPSTVALGSSFGMFVEAIVSAAAATGLLSISAVYFTISSPVTGTAISLYSGIPAVGVTKYTATYNAGFPNFSFPTDTKAFTLRLRYENNAAALGAGDIYIGGCRLEARTVAGPSVLANVKMPTGNALVDGTVLRWQNVTVTTSAGLPDIVYCKKGSTWDELEAGIPS